MPTAFGHWQFDPSAFATRFAPLLFAGSTFYFHPYLLLCPLTLSTLLYSPGKTGNSLSICSYNEYILVTNVESKSTSQMNFEGDEEMEDRELKMFIMSHTNLTIFAI